MSQKRDYYEVLGVSRDAEMAEISVAYRKLAIQFHPDKNPGDEEAIHRFKESAEAFEVLSDEQKRARYDRFGHAGVGTGDAGPAFTDVEDIFSAFGDIFGDIFGGGRQHGGRRRVRRGADIRCNLTLDLMEAASGVARTVSFQRHEPCDDCDGSGARQGTGRVACDYCGGHGQVVQSSGIFRMQTTCPSCHGEGTVIADPCTTCRGSGLQDRNVTVDVNIPAGVDNSMQVRMAGEGQPSPNGGPPGDCYCFITVRDHPLFERDGQHLICRVPITYSQAALGATIEVPTLSGRTELEIPSGTQPAQVFRLRGLGMPDPRRRGVGDLLVEVNIEVPSRLSPREMEVLRELAELENANVTPTRETFFEKLKSYFVADHQVEASD